MDKDRAFLMRSMAALTPQFDMRVEYGKPDDDYLVELDGWVYIARGEIEIRRVTLVEDSVVKAQGYIVQKAMVFPGRYSGPPGDCYPDDVDIVDDSEHQHISDAIKAAVLLLAEQNIINTLSGVSEEMYFEERKAEEQVWDAM